MTRLNQDPNRSKSDAKRRVTGESMLEYAERLREISASKNVHGHHDNRHGSFKTRASRERSVNEIFSHNRGNDFLPYYTDSRPLRRPLSNKEKELYRRIEHVEYENLKLIYTSEYGSVSHKPDSTDFEPDESYERLNINFAKVPDFDLKYSSNSAEGLREESAVGFQQETGNIQLTEDCGLKSHPAQSEKNYFNFLQQNNRRSTETLSRSTRRSYNKPMKVITVEDSSTLVTRRKIRNDLELGDKQKSNSTISDHTSDELKFFEGTKLVNIEDKTEEISDTRQDDNCSPDILLVHADSQNNNSIQSHRRLQRCSVRGNRMDFRKPELHAIPEDGGTFANSENLENARNSMLSSSPRSSRIRAFRDRNVGDESRNMVNTGEVERRSLRGTSHETINKSASSFYRTNLSYSLTNDLGIDTAKGMYPFLPLEVPDESEQWTSFSVPEKRRQAYLKTVRRN